MKRTFMALIAAAVSVVGLVGAGAVPAQAAPSPALRIMPLGDSITWGVGSSSNSSYRAPLWSTVTGAGYSLDFVGSQNSGSLPDTDHEGHSGWKINDIAGIAADRMTSYQPNVVTLHIGTNDINGNDDVADAPARLGSLIDRIYAATPDTTIVLAQIIPILDATTQKRVDTFNAALPGLVDARVRAGRHLVLVDMSRPLNAADMSDGLHPNDAGYTKMATSFWTGIQSAISKGWLREPTAGAGGRLKGQESGRCIDVPSSSTSNGSPVALWDCNGGANQTFVSTGSKQLQVYGNKCLDAADGGTGDGTAVIIWDCNGGANQQWTLNSEGTIVGTQSGKCLDATAHGTANATRIQLWTCNGGANQKYSRT